MTTMPHTDAVPASITVHPCPSWPDRVALAANLNQVASDPKSVVADLIAAEDAINQGARG
jgi:hypothetical protein